MAETGEGSSVDPQPSSSDGPQATGTAATTSPSVIYTSTAIEENSCFIRYLLFSAEVPRTLLLPPQGVLRRTTTCLEVNILFYMRQEIPYETTLIDLGQEH